MAYSGTVGTTVVNVQELIDHAARRCGKLAEELTSEQQLTARQSLYYFLSSLINIGIQYWAINKEVIVKRPDAAELLLIRNGVSEYDDLLIEAENTIGVLDDLYDKSDLPENINHEYVNNLLINFRNKFYILCP
jgi:hypothetical protein